MIDLELDRRIERARHLFLEGGEIPDHLIDDSVARSWQRSRGYGLRTGDKVIFNVVTAAERRRVEDANRALVGYAEPELQRLLLLGTSEAQGMPMAHCVALPPG